MGSSQVPIASRPTRGNENLRPLFGRDWVRKLCGWRPAGAHGGSLTEIAAALVTSVVVIATPLCLKRYAPHLGFLGFSGWALGVLLLLVALGDLWANCASLKDDTITTFPEHWPPPPPTVTN